MTVTLLPVPPLPVELAPPEALELPPVKLALLPVAVFRGAPVLPELHPPKTPNARPKPNQSLSLVVRILEQKDTTRSRLGRAGSNVWLPCAHGFHAHSEGCFAR